MIGPAATRDGADPLASFRARFRPPAEPDGPVYLDGNSLGRPLDATGERVRELLVEWEQQLVGGWERWIDVPGQVGDLIGRAALGAAPGQVLACDSVTVNLYKLASAAVAARPGALLVPRDEFPTDRYVLEGIAAAAGRRLRWIEPADDRAGPTADDVERAAGGEPVALACLSQVHYRSAARADLGAIAPRVQAAGGLLLADVSHSAGSVPAGLDAAGVDLAVGCTYKYLSGGPGAPGFLYVREDLQDELTSPIQGWFGQRDQFAMGPAYQAAPGVGRFLAGTPSILALAAVVPGAELVEEATIEEVGAKGEALTSFAVELFDEHLASLGFGLGSPREAQRRGAALSLRHPDAWRICRSLIDRGAVVGDFRAPDSLRLGFPALSLSFAEVEEAMLRTRDLVAAGAHAQAAAERSRVT